jgi:nucleoside-diphosphate-sugar epimerase
MIIEEAGVDLEPEYLDVRPGELRWSVGDNSKAQRLLGWKPTIYLRQTIRDLIDVWKP